MAPVRNVQHVPVKSYGATGGLHGDLIIRSATGSAKQLRVRQCGIAKAIAFGALYVLVDRKREAPRGPSVASFFAHVIARTPAELPALNATCHTASDVWITEQENLVEQTWRATN